jgi:hypothetical protein
VHVREPLLVPFASVAAGITLAGGRQFSLAEAGLAAIAIAALAWIAHLSKSSQVVTRGACCCALFFAGAAAVARPSPAAPALSVPDNMPAIFEGCVVDPALVATDRERFTVELAPRARAQVSLSTHTTFPELPYGTRLEFQGKVRQPHNYNDPGTFDAVNYLARQQIYWTATGDAANVHVLAGHCGNRIAGFIFAVRSAALNRLDNPS